VESHTTQANTQLVLTDGSRSPTVFAASSLAIAEDSVGCSPGTRAARAVTIGGPGAAALEYLDEGEEAEDPATTAEDDSSEDEKPAPEDDGSNTRPSDKPFWRALGRWWELKSSFVCSLTPTRQRVDSIHQASLKLFAHLGFFEREHGDLDGDPSYFFRSPGSRRERKTNVGKA
jgi:hypothetical protein